MKITFGVITEGNSDLFIKKIHESIINQDIDDNFEIIIVGGNDPKLEHTIHIPFDESVKRAWITKKKNIIAQEARYDNIILMHDYVYFDELWYHNFKSYTDDWDVCMNSIINADGQRFRDWITWPEWCLENDIIKVNDKLQYISNRLFSLSGGDHEMDLTYDKLRESLNRQGFTVLKTLGIGGWIFRHSFQRKEILESKMANVLERVSRVVVPTSLCPDMILIAKKH